MLNQIHNRHQHNTDDAIIMMVGKQWVKSWSIYTDEAKHAHLGKESEQQ